MADISLGSRFKSAWNAFFSRDPTETLLTYDEVGSGSYYRPDRTQYSRGNERSIVTAIYNRITTDVAAIDIKHVKLDENDRYISTVDSKLNNCLTLEANKDQTSRAFVQDLTASMLDEGCVAIVPIDTTRDPFKTDSYDIETMRTGSIKEWFPDYIKVEVYNDTIGRKQEIIMPKKDVAIIENPFYSVMNEPNSTLQRLKRKLVLLDIMDERNSSGKLDLIFQLPYTVKTELKRKQADQRRKDIEDQLVGSKYGIAYIDAAEHVTQLNRPAENNLMSQVEYLTSMLYSQLGITQEILNGTADEQTMLNYNNRIIEPILSAIVDEMKRKFLTKTARTQHQSIVFFSDPFRLVPVSQISEIADKFTRNEIMTSNEIRQVIGMLPSKDPNADELRNKNLSAPKEDNASGASEKEIGKIINERMEEIQNE